MLPLSIYLFIIHVAITRQYCFSRDSTPPPLKREQNKCNNSTQGRIHGAHPARAKTFGVFRVKHHDFAPKNHIFFQF
jgi:hypothetical protein